MSGVGQRFGPISSFRFNEAYRLFVFAKNYNLGQFQLDVC